MKNIIFVLILVIFISFFISVFKKDLWSGYFYPSKDNLSDWIESGFTFKSLDSCRVWAQNKGIELNIKSSTYDYECGLNCKYKDGFNICEKTLD